MKKNLIIVTFVVALISTLAGIKSLEGPATGQVGLVPSKGKLASIFPLSKLFAFASFNVQAATPDPSCENEGVWDTIFQLASTYSHSDLGTFNFLFKMANDGAMGEVENALCHYKNSMGMTGAPSQDISVTMDMNGTSVVVRLVVEETTGTLNTTWGYNRTGTIYVNGSSNPYMKLHWATTSTDGLQSKGFMIVGAGGLSEPGYTRANYVQWDRTDSNNQVLRVLNAEYASSYLGTGRSSSTYGDRVMYAAFNYNTSNNRILARAMVIEDNDNSGTTSFVCRKMWASGTKGGTMTIAIEGAAAVSDTDTNSAGMTGTTLVDATSTSSGTSLNASQLASAFAATSPFLDSDGSPINTNFAFTCNTLNNDGNSGGAFATATTVTDMSAIPSDYFDEE